MNVYEWPRPLTSHDLNITFFLSKPLVNECSSGSSPPNTVVQCSSKLLTRRPILDKSIQIYANLQLIMLGALPLIINVYSTSVIHTATLGSQQGKPTPAAGSHANSIVRFPWPLLGTGQELQRKYAENGEGWPARVDRLSALSNAGFSSLKSESGTPWSPCDGRITHKSQNSEQRVPRVPRVPRAPCLVFTIPRFPRYRPQIRTCRGVLQKGFAATAPVSPYSYTSTARTTQKEGRQVDNTAKERSVENQCGRLMWNWVWKLETAINCFRVLLGSRGASL